MPSLPVAVMLAVPAVRAPPPMATSATSAKPVTASEKTTCTSKAVAPSWVDGPVTVTVGATVSTGTISGAAVAVLPLPATSRTLSAGRDTCTSPVKPAVGVTCAVHTSGSAVAASVAPPLVTSRSSATKAPSPVVCNPFASVNVTVTENTPARVVSRLIRARQRHCRPGVVKRVRLRRPTAGCR